MADFEEQVALRIRPERRAALPVEVRLVEVQPLAEGARGRVVLSGRAHETTREIRAASCAEAVEALALIVAILLDPEADTRPHVSRQSESAPIVAPEPPPLPTGSVYFGAGIDWSALGGVGPELLFGPRAYLELGRRVPAQWSPSLRVSVLRAASGSVEQGAGEAAFWLDAARLDGCVFRWADRGASLEPCAAFEAGTLSATSSHPDGARSRTLGWAAASALLRGGLYHAGILAVQGELGVGLPFTRYRFRFSGQEPLYTSAELGLRAGLGVGVRFP